MTNVDNRHVGHQQASRRSIIAFTSLIATVSILACTIFFSLPSNVLSIRDGGRLRTLSVELAQQSWVFFTRPPSYNEYAPFDVSADGGLTSTLRFPQTNSGNLYGLRRWQRAQGPELANVVNQAETWFDCKAFEGSEECAREALAATSSPMTAVNTSPVATMCGRTVIVETEPVRWAFRNMYEVKRLPVQALILDLECTDPSSNL